jgi:iron complex outermembrane receptor protein
MPAGPEGKDMAKGTGRVVLLLGLFLEAAALLGAPRVSRSADQAAHSAEPPASSPSSESLPASPSSDTPTAGEGLSEVVVTARFKSENLQTAPIAITAVSADQIDARGYVNVADVAHAAPNVNIEQAGSGFGKSAFVSIRGIGQNDFKYTFEPGVGFYIDDVYFGTVFGSLFDLTDIDSVEILRGPQGTLFGKNTEGGAVRIFTKKPTGDDSGYLEAGLGSFDREKFRGAYDFALIPNQLFVRVSAGSNRSDGYMDVLDFACANPTLAGTLKPVTHLNGCKIGTYGGDDVQVARLAVRYLASDTLETNFSADFTDDHGEEPATKMIALALPPKPNGTPGVPGTQISNALALYSIAATIPRFGIPLDSRFLTNSPYTTYGTYTDPIAGISASPTSTLTSWGVAGTVDWDTPWDGVHAKSITAYRRYHGAFAEDTSGAPISGDLPINYLRHHQFSEELQFSGRALQDTLDWATGAYYLDSEDFNSGIVDNSSNVGGKGILFLTGDPAASKDESVFAHVNYKVTSALGLELGARYSHETKTYTFYRYEPDLVGLVPAGLFPTNLGNYLAGFAPPLPTGEVSVSRVDPKVGLSYQWTPDIMTYAQYSTGYKSGGFNPRPLTRTQVTSFGPEKVSSYEVGLKSEWLDHRLRANLAGFVSNYSELQLPVATVDPGTGFPAFLTESVGSARIKGLELEIEARPVGGLLIDGSVGYLHYRTLNLGGAAYNPVTNPGGPTLSDVPALTPTWKGNVGAQYALPLGGAGTLTPRLDYTYQSKVFNDPQDELISMQAGYGLLNVRLTWEALKGGWQVSLSASNVTGKVYYVTERNQLSTYDEVDGQPGRPREVLFSVRKTF